ncbi:MAG: glycosyltransferase family 2 protein [Alphaproteobacteria bacterium]
MASWGLVATVKAPEAKVMAWAAHHLAIGASHLWIYFDNPEDPVPAVLRGHPRITATLCDAAYWADKRRHDNHQNRQGRNARHAYTLARTDWLGHIDVDEFIHVDRPLDQILDAVPAGQRVVKLEPFEAMHDPMLPDDIFTAREFRGALTHDVWRYRTPALGPYKRVIRDGILSHSVGKVLFRTGIRGLMPRLHSVMLNGQRLPAPEWCGEARLLHFHAQDRAAWLAALPYRLTRGAYQFRPALQQFLSLATPDEVETFYRRTQILATGVSEQLQEFGRVVVADLDLRQKVKTILGETR